MIRRHTVTIPVTHEAQYGSTTPIADVLKSHARDRGAPVDLIEPVSAPSETLPHVTEFTWTWFVLDTLAAPQTTVRTYGYTAKWNGVGLLPEDYTDDKQIQVFGLGRMSAEDTEELALEMLAAVVAARERMKTDDAQG